MPRQVFVDGVEKVDLPEVRQAIPYVHAYLRELILNGNLVPGTKLSQVTLAEQLGVSRTPLREVLRMLQEEGLVAIEPNQRTRVAGLDPQLSEPGTWQTAGQSEHQHVFDALIAGDERGAIVGMARHLARTALRVLSDCAPDYEPVAVPHAVSLIDRRPPKDLVLGGNARQA